MAVSLRWHPIYFPSYCVLVQKLIRAFFVGIDPPAFKSIHKSIASSNALLIILQAKEQIRLYEDLLDLIGSMPDSNNDVHLRERFSKFEAKYGSFEDLRQGNTIDHNLLASALISELKKKLQ